MIESSVMEQLRVWFTRWDDARVRRASITLLGVLSGLLLGLILDTIFREIGNNLFPWPPLYDLATPEQQAELMKTMDPAAFITELVAWFLGAFCGGYVAERIAKRGGYPAWVVGGLMCVGAIVTMASLPHPLWVKILSLPLIGLGAYGAGFVAVLMNGRAVAARRLKAARMDPLSSPDVTDIGED